MPSPNAVAYVKERFSKVNPMLAGRELSADEARDFFNELAAAYDADRPKMNGTITVRDSLGISHFHPNGSIEHEAVSPRAKVR
ncbi:MAG TPA: hypothetical protein VJP85_05685 [Candidatus Baltobacteraceae bacterium]|nr:hypothetical protein [Candidatus Baltobacteraceae bacterium]